MKAKEWICPYYRRKVDDCECLDLYLIALGPLLKVRKMQHDALQRGSSVDDKQGQLHALHGAAALYAMCRVCGKHGVIEGK